MTSRRRGNQQEQSLGEMLRRNARIQDDNNVNDDDMGEAGHQLLPESLQGLSKQVLQRVKALKKIQLEGLQVESQFYQKVHELEMQFQPLFDEINSKRRKIVVGEYEPAEYECDLPLINDIEPDELQRIEENAPIEQGSPSKGVPGFWYHVMNSTQLADCIFDVDVPILKDYLEDITTEAHSNPPGFSLLFHFAENPHFTNKTLRKYYQLEIGLPQDGSNPFMYDGPTILSCQGCEIEWRDASKNVTVKLVKKKANKGPNAGKMITKTVSNDETFFAFFSPKYTQEQQDMDPEALDQLHQDFELGQIIRDELIPRAVLYFTGEVADEGDDFNDFEDEDEEEDEHDDDE